MSGIRWNKKYLALKIILKINYAQLLFTNLHLSRCVESCHDGFYIYFLYNVQKLYNNKRFTRYVNMKPEFLYRKYTFLYIVWKWLKIFYSKYCPSLAIHFSHLSDNWWMPRQKKLLSLFWGKPVIEPFSYIFVKVKCWNLYCSQSKMFLRCQQRLLASMMQFSDNYIIS